MFSAHHPQSQAAIDLLSAPHGSCDTASASAEPKVSLSWYMCDGMLVPVIQLTPLGITSGCHGGVDCTRHYQHHHKEPQCCQTELDIEEKAQGQPSGIAQ